MYTHIIYIYIYIYNIYYTIYIVYIYCKRLCVYIGKSMSIKVKSVFLYENI